MYDFKADQMNHGEGNYDHCINLLMILQEISVGGVVMDQSDNGSGDQF